MKYSRCDNTTNTSTDSVKSMIMTSTSTVAGAGAGSGSGAITVAATSSSISMPMTMAMTMTMPMPMPVPVPMKTTTTNNVSSLKKITMSPVTSSSGFLSDLSPTPSTSTSTSTSTNYSGTQFSDEFRTVENLYEKWSDCERTVVLYALLKRLRYPCLKFLQYSIDNNLTQHAVSQSTMNAVIADINANNPSYLQNLYNAYNTFHLGDIADAFSSTSTSASSSASSASSTSTSTSSSLLVSVSASASGASDKESMPCYGTGSAGSISNDFQFSKPIMNGDERKLYRKKEDILNEILNILPLLKPGNEDAKTIYLSLIPEAVKDTIKQLVPPELVQQIFSYLLIHPAVTSDDRRSLNVWLSQLEDFLHCSQRAANSFFLSSSQSNSKNSLNAENLMVTSVCSASSSCSSSSVVSGCSGGGGGSGGNNSSLTVPSSISGQRNNDWQTIAPPAKYKQHYQQQQHQQQKQQQQQQQNQQQPKVSQLSDWCDALNRRRQSCGGISTSITDQLCDNFNGIKLNGELGSSHSHANSLGLSSLVVTGDTVSTVSMDSNESSLVNGVVAAVASAAAAAAASQSQSQSNMFCGGVGSVANVANAVGGNCANSHGNGNGNNNGVGVVVVNSNNINTNPIINIISNNNSEELNNDDHDTSFSKNGTDFDFEPPNSGCNSCTNSMNQFSSPKEPFGGLSQPFSSLFVSASNNDQLMDANRWSLDSKIAALKTRRSNSLTTQTILTSSSSTSSSGSSASSSNSSVVTVNDNCSNSTENLAQFANKPRSFSLSIENQQRSALINGGGSDTRLDDFKPNYIKFQTRNIGMSNIGTWLKSLRLHKYVELFFNLTYEDMLQITEEYLQNLGVTKGASHKLAICIEKLKERPTILTNLEQDLLSGKTHVNKAVEDLTNMVLTPMKPIETSTDGSTSSTDGNVALLFLRAIELVCSIVQRDPYSLSEDESLNSIVWILDRAIHSEAFISHINQLKDLKFQISKLKIAFAPRLHYSKNGTGNTNLANLNKTRWNGKPRKCDSKNGSNDRINYRKNSGDMLNFNQNQQGANDYSQIVNNSGYMNAQQTQQATAFQQPSTQSQPPHIAQQQNHFPSLPQPNQSNQQQKQAQQQTLQQQKNCRSLNNLILVSGGPQQPQKMIFKPVGQQHGVLSMTTTNSIRSSADNLQTEKLLPHQQHQQHHQQQQQQQRKGSLASVLNQNANANTNNNNNTNSNSNIANNTSTNSISNNNNNLNNNKSNILNSNKQQPMNNIFTNNNKTTTKTQIISSNNNSNNNNNNNNELSQQHLQHQQPKKTMAAVVMVSNNDSISTDNLENVCQQEKQQHQQLRQQTAAAATTTTTVTATNPTQLLIQNDYGNVKTNNNDSDNHNRNRYDDDDDDDDNNDEHNSNLISQQQLQLLAAAAAYASCTNLQKENNIIGSVAAAAAAAATATTATTAHCICNNSCSCTFSSNNSKNSCAATVATIAAASLKNSNSNTVVKKNHNSSNSNSNIKMDDCNPCNCNASSNNLLLLNTTKTPSSTTATTTSPLSCSCVNMIAKPFIETHMLMGENPSSSPTTTTTNRINDMKSLEQLETLCLQMTEQAIN